MHELDEIIDAEKKGPATFHPVHERGEDSWFPGNEAAALVVQIGHIWEDLLELIDLRQSTSDGYKRKLLLKYAVIEVRSLIEVFDRLQAIVMKAGTFDPRERHGWREITVEEREEAKELLKGYSESKKSVANRIIGIRNMIGAHRGSLDWQQTMAFWDSISPALIQPVLDSIPPAFNFIKELDLFEWNRTPSEGGLEVIGSMLRPEYFEAKK